MLLLIDRIIQNEMWIMSKLDSWWTWLNQQHSLFSALDQILSMPLKISISNTNTSVEHFLEQQHYSYNKLYLLFICLFSTLSLIYILSLFNVGIPGSDTDVHTCRINQQKRKSCADVGCGNNQNRSTSVHLFFFCLKEEKKFTPVGGALAAQISCTENTAVSLFLTVDLQRVSWFVTVVGSWM